MRRLLASVLFTALGLFAQESSPHVLTGRVLDPASEPVSGATVRLYSRDNSLARETATGPLGQYRFERLPAGEFLLEARTTGLDQASPISVAIGKDPEIIRDVQLELAKLASQVVVTAEATPQSTVESGKAMDIVDGADLSRRELTTFPDAVRWQPGLRVQQLGGPGSFSRIQIRGLRAADTGLLVDGMRMRDAASVEGDATAFLGDLQLVDTGRIEILRGLGSSLYGTSATAGVINIVTDQGGGRAHGQVSGEGGGLGLSRGLAHMAGGLLHDRLQYSAGMAYLNVAGGVDGVEHVHNTSGQGSLLWRSSPTSSLSGRVWGTTSTVGVNTNPEAAPDANLPATGTIPAIPLAESQVHRADQSLPFDWGNATFAPNLYDPDSRRVGDFVTTMVNWNQQASRRFSYRLSYQDVTSNRDNRDGPAGPGFFQPLFNTSSIFAGRLDTLEARADIVVAKWNLFTAGYEWEREYYENLSTDRNPDPAYRLYARATGVQRSNSVFATDQFRLLADRLQISLGGRFQGFNLSAPSFEGGSPVYQGAAFPSPLNAYTGDAAISYLIPRSSTKLRAHAGNGFRSPTLYERIGSYFFLGSFSGLGDPGLRPERTVSFDFGFDQYLANSRYRLSSTYFYTRLQEVVGFGYLTDDPYGRYGGYVNVGGGFARGVEASLEARPWRRLIFNSSYTYTNAAERESSLVGGLLQSIRIFPHMFTLTAAAQLSKRIDLTSSFLAASGYISGSFFVGSGNRPYLFPGPRRLDASLNYSLPLGERVTLRFFTRVENILNQRYFEDGFRIPTAWATGGMKVLF